MKRLVSQIAVGIFTPKWMLANTAEMAFGIYSKKVGYNVINQSSIVQVDNKKRYISELGHLFKRQIEITHYFKQSCRFLKGMFADKTYNNDTEVISTFFKKN